MEITALHSLLSGIYLEVCSIKLLNCLLTFIQMNCQSLQVDSIFSRYLLRTVDNTGDTILTVQATK